MTTEECPFCDLNQFEARLIQADELTYSFLSDPRLVPGHTLVIPKRHVEHPAGLTTTEASAIHRQIGQITTKMLGAMAVGVDLWQKTRPNVKQDEIKIDHLHYHLLPSNEGDPIYSGALIWSKNRFTHLPPDERDLLKELFS